MDLTTRLTASMKSGTQQSSIDMSIASVAWRYPNVVPPLLSPASRAMPKSTWPCPPSPAGSPHPMNISLFIQRTPEGRRVEEMVEVTGYDHTNKKYVTNAL